MKLGFAFLLLTCASLFPQNGTVQPISPEVRCHATCGTQLKANLATCQKMATTDAKKKTCEADAQKAAASCNDHCNPPIKH